MTLYLVRHGSAGIRHDDDPGDADRHLDEDGRRQALALIEILGSHGIGRVVSSPANRCVETVQPLADAVGAAVEIHPDLFEGTAIEDSWALVESLARSSTDTGTHAVLCSHGDVIPEVVSRARGRGMEIPGKSGCSKGSIWTLRWDGERFDLGEYSKNRP